MFSQTLLLLVTILDSGAGNASQKNPPPTATPASQHVGETASGSAAKARVAARLSAGDIVTKVQGFYLETQHLTALFRQTYTNSTFGKTSVSDGKVWIKKPGKMRWDYIKKGKSKKANKSFVSDGTTLWAVEHDNKQITRTKIEDDVLPVAVTFLFGKGDLSRDFRPALDKSGKYGTKKDYVLELTPRTPSAQYTTLYLVVDPENFRVKQSIVVEASGNINHFRFYSPDTRAEVKDSWFTLNVKKFKKYRLIEPSEDTP